MAELNPGQRRALRTYLDETPVQKERKVEYIYSGGQERFAGVLLATQPWSQILTEWDIPAASRTVLHALEQEIPADFEGPLQRSPGAAGLVGRMEQVLVDFLQSIPRPYFACFEVPGIPTLGQAVIELSRDVALLDTSEGFDDSLLQRPSRGLRLQIQPPRLRRNTRYLRFSVPGYTDGSADTYSAIWAVARLKHFLFLGIHVDKSLTGRGLADLYGDRYSVRTGPPDTHGFIYNPAAVDKEAYLLGVSDELWNYLKFIRLNEANLQVPDGEKGALRPAKNAEENVQALPNAVTVAAWFGSLADDFKDADRVRAGIEWFVDSETSGNQTMSFIQACIGLEAVLGDKEKSRVTERLADRYSYLLGRTESERKDLRDKFLDMYDKRSTIVHGRRARLGTDDLVSMVRARQMLRRCVAVEVAGLRKAMLEPAKQ